MLCRFRSFLVHVRRFSTDSQKFKIRAKNDLKYLYNGNRCISPWHDVSLYTKQEFVLNFVNEIPKGTRAKLEIETSLAYNPIVQDGKNGKLRFYHSDSLVNYGFLPQTWEDPMLVNEQNLGCSGDNDPLDVVEIGSQRMEVGEVCEIKVLGVLAMIDEGEMDWKIIGLRKLDPMADCIDTLADLKKYPEMVHKVDEIHAWFRDYKIPDGKPPSKFGFDGVAQDRALAMRVVEETHASWKALCTKEGPLWHSSKS